MIDLSDLTNPRIVATVEGPQGPNNSFGSGIGHDWDVDEAGIAWWVGTGGIVAYDVDDTTDPQILNTSDENSIDPLWNNYVSHNSQRPNATAFGTGGNGDDDGLPGQGPPSELPGQGPPGERPGAPGGDSSTADADEPDISKGNVLYVTEEDLSDNGCSETIGGFQTWHIPELDPSVNPDGTAEKGTITPLDQWTAEMASDPAAQLPAAFCSGHYFDTHDSGIVAQGWYQQGLRILDPRDPHDIKQIGYYITAGAQETWGASWVPEYDEDGVQTGEPTNLLYTEDPSRGMDILEVDLPEEGEDGVAVEAPILPQWQAGSPDLAARAESSEWGGACVLPPGAS